MWIRLIERFIHTEKHLRERGLKKVIQTFVKLLCSNCKKLSTFSEKKCVSKHVSVKRQDIYT